MKFWDNVGDPSYVLSNAFARFCMSRFTQQMFATKSWNRRKPNKCKGFLSPIFSGWTTPTFLRQIVSANYRPPFGKVWLSSVCRSLRAKYVNEVECRIYRGWVKTHFQFEAVCGPKFMSFWDDVGDPCSLQCTCSIVYIMFLFEHIIR